MTQLPRLHRLSNTLAQRVAGLQSGTGRRLLESAFWSMAAETLSRGLLLLSLVFVGRTLGAEAYGQFGMIRSTIGVFATIGGMGLGLTATRFVAEFRDSDKPYSGQVIGSSYVLALTAGGLVGLAVLLAAPYLAVTVIHAPQLLGALRVAALLLVISALNGTQIGILQGLEAYRLLAFGSLLQGATALICLVGGSSIYGLDGAIGGLLIQSVVGAIVFQTLIRQEVKRQRIQVRYTQFAATLPLFWRFSLPVMMMGTAIAPIKWLAETQLVRTVGFTELGIFNASLTIASMLVAGVSTMNAPLISLAANAETDPDSGRLQFLNLYSSWYAMLLFAVPLALFPRFTAALFGAKYATTQFYVVNLLLLAHSALMMYYQGVMRLVAQKGSMWFGFMTNVFEGAGLLLGFHLFATRGAAGLGLAYVLSYLIRIAVSLPHLLKGHIVPLRLLFDKYFVGSLGLLTLIIMLQLRRLL